MKIFCTASSDAYITDKIIENRLRAEDANTGQAGTLDLFKLYDETTLMGTGSQNEISRILVKFDLAKVAGLMSSKLDIRDASFSAKIKMFDVLSGHGAPANFTVAAYPLSAPFDEGLGKDLSSFSDLGAVNFLTSSIVNSQAKVWNLSGSNKPGHFDHTLGKDHASMDTFDIIGSGTFDPTAGIQNLYGTQYFKEGTEDLEIDVTLAVSATLAGVINNNGFRIGFHGTDDTDQKTRFVKRFGSRHSANPLIRPRLEISFDDSVRDDRGNLIFDAQNTLFLQNFQRSVRANLKSGSNDVTGDNSVRVKLSKGSYSKTFLASQYKNGSDDSAVLGLYSGDFTIFSNDNSEYERGKTLQSLIDKEKKVTFDEYWYSLDESFGYHTGSVTVYKEGVKEDQANEDFDVYAINCKTEYDKAAISRIRLFCLGREKEKISPVKKPVSKKSDILETVYYRVKDADSHLVLLEFGESDNSTRVSTDAQGLYFDFHFDVLPPGRAYFFEYLIVENDSKKVIPDKRTRFTVV